MRKYKQKDGKMTLVDFAMVIHAILEEPLDEVKQYPTFGSNVVKAIMKAITDALHRGENVSINGFGKFVVSPAHERNIHNIGISSGGKPFGAFSPVPIKVKYRKRVLFYPSVQLSAMLNHEDPNHHERIAISIWDK